MVMMKSPLLLLTAAAASAVAQTLPIVDLGYVRQQATGMNVWPLPPPLHETIGIKIQHTSNMN